MTTPKNPAAVQLGRKGGAARVSKGPLANKTPEEKSAWGKKMAAAKLAKKEGAKRTKIREGR